MSKIFNYDTVALQLSTFVSKFSSLIKNDNFAKNKNRHKFCQALATLSAGPIIKCSQFSIKKGYVTQC